MTTPPPSTCEAAHLSSEASCRAPSRSSRKLLEFPNVKNTPGLVKRSKTKRFPGKWNGGGERKKNRLLEKRSFGIWRSTCSREVYSLSTLSISVLLNVSSERFFFQVKCFRGATSDMMTGCIMETIWPIRNPLGGGFGSIFKGLRRKETIIPGIYGSFQQ